MIFAILVSCSDEKQNEKTGELADKDSVETVDDGAEDKNQPENDGENKNDDDKNQETDQDPNACADNQCFIGSKCIDHGTIDESHACQKCDVVENRYEWTLLGSDSICRVSAGECDVAETCDGENIDCPADIFADSTTLCGDKTTDTECDKPDTCDGAGNCIPNFLDTETTCGDAGTGCVNQDYCDGAGQCEDFGIKDDYTNCGDFQRCVSGICTDKEWDNAMLLENYDEGHAGLPTPVVDDAGNVTVVWSESKDSSSALWARRFTSGSGWSKSRMIGIEDGEVIDDPRFAVDGNGNVIIVWTKQVDGGNKIFANRFEKSVGWDSVQNISGSDMGNVNFPVLAMDWTGTATVLFHQSEDTRDSIWCRRFVSGSGWSELELVEKIDGGNLFFPLIAVDDDGNITALWGRYSEGKKELRSKRYVKGSGWVENRKINTGESVDLRSHRLVVDQAGYVTAVWLDVDGQNKNVWTNRYSPENGWGSAEMIESNNAGISDELDLVADGTGNVTVIWQRYDEGKNSLWANRYSVEFGWGIAQLIETDDSGSTGDAVLLVDGQGNATVSWKQHDGTRDNLWSNRFNMGVGWAVPELLENDDSGNAVRPELVVDEAGNVTVAWQQHDSTVNNLWSSRYTDESGWSTPELIEENNDGDVKNHRLVIDSSGNITAVWQQFDGDILSGGKINVWVNRFY